MKGKHLVVILILALLLPIAVVVSFLYQPYTWGADGALTLTISLDRTSMSVNETLNVTLTLTNTGGTRLRYYDGFFTPSLSITDSENKGVKWYGPSYCPPRTPTDEEFNKGLNVMEPGAVRSFGEPIRAAFNYSGHGWALDTGETFSVQGHYYAQGGRRYPVLPHWSGQVDSAQVQFSVTV